MANLLAITYSDRDRAKSAMSSVDWLNFDHQLDVKAACWVTKDDDKLVVHEKGQGHVAKKAVGGTLGLIVGGIFGLPVVGVAAGIAAAGHRAKRDDQHIDPTFIESVGAALESGGSAIFILWDEGADTGRSAVELSKYGGEVHSTDLTPEQFTRFQSLLDRANTELAASEGDTLST